MEALRWGQFPLGPAMLFCDNRLQPPSFNAWRERRVAPEPVQGVTEACDYDEEEILQALQALQAYKIGSIRDHHGWGARRTFLARLA